MLLLPGSSLVLLLLLLTAQPVDSAESTGGSSSHCASAVDGGALVPSAGSVQGSCAGTSASSGSFVCGGLGNLVQMPTYIGHEDFALSATLMLETSRNDTAASLILLSEDGAENHVGFDGFDGYFIECVGSACAASDWPKTNTKPSEPTPAPLPGKFFNITLTRTGTTLAVSIDGAKAFAVQPTSFAVTGFALRPWRSTMQIRSFRVCAAALPAPGAPPPPPPSVFSPGEAGVPIYRIPVRSHQNVNVFFLPRQARDNIGKTQKQAVFSQALCNAGPALVAFAEGRLGGDFSIKKLMTKRSTDAGATWSAATLVPGTWESGWVVGQPTCAYDPVRKLLVLQYQNSTTLTQVNGATYLLRGFATPVLEKENLPP